MATLNKIVFEEFGPFRFIGKSVYARAGAEYSGQIFGGLWCNGDTIFNTLDNMREYSTSEIFDVALITMDKYDDEKKLIGYTVGRFMKAGAPVPDGMDYFDIPDMYVAKGWIGGRFHDMITNAERLTADAIDAQTEYTASWDVIAEVYTKESIPDDNVDSVMGYYIGCKIRGQE